MARFGGIARMLVGVPILAALAGPALAGATGVATYKRDIDLDYAIYFGGFKVIKLDVGLALDGGQYDLNAAMETQGFVARMFPWSMRANSKGRLGPAVVRPREAHAENTWRGKKGWVTLRFDADGPKVVSAEPVRELVAIPPEDMRDTVDVASAILLLSSSFDAGRACDTKVPVFDGRRRFDFVIDRFGEEQMVRNRYSAFSGTALRCKVGMDVLFGRKRKHDYGGFGSDGRSATIWIAPIFKGVPSMPVRVEYDTRWGLIVAHLAGAKMTGDGPVRELRRAR